MEWKTDLAKLAEYYGNAPTSRLRFDEPMEKHVFFGIGGLAAAYFEVTSVQELAAVASLKKRWNMPVATLGRGSNLLVSDNGYNGIVLRLVKELEGLEFDGDRVWAGAGVSLPRLSKVSARQGLSGIEFALGIPGSVGGALIMNAGAWGSSFGDVVERVQVMTYEGEVIELSRDEAQFAYRRSRLGRYFSVTGALLRLRPGDAGTITERMNELYSKKIATQPFAEENAGCIFKNPPNDSAGRLIDKCGLKGHRIGGSEVSKVHGNFILNIDSATAEDVLCLVRHIQQQVKQLTGVDLQIEVKMLGFDNE
ncbi:MAG: UDP-N-acetylmuramate dehydrogenase [Candidatus Poribacteria bacterium]|nr:UDP-N-acetylmuramate dehydrogenase [Candidatus Poribacteria bacterium]